MKKYWSIAGAFIVLGLPLYWLLTYCKHKFSMPFTVRDTTITYVVCLTCGKEFDFDLNTMKAGKRRKYGV